MIRNPHCDIFLDKVTEDFAKNIWDENLRTISTSQIEQISNLWR